jgi:hypothetical protein
MFAHKYNDLSVSEKCVAVVLPEAQALISRYEPPGF